MAKASQTVVRVRLAGLIRARKNRRMILASGAVVGIAAVTLVATALWPLPRTEDSSAPSPRGSAAALPEHESLAEREALLADLLGAGNIFAADRSAWRDESVAEASGEPEEETPEPEIIFLTAGSAAFPAEIELTERPTAAAKKSRDALYLRGLFASGDERLAMIQGGESDRRKDVELYREGDIFFAETWQLLRIDPDRDRVILEHLGQGDVVELTLYDASAPRLAAAPAEPPVTLEILRATESQVRGDLLGAGIAQDDVDRVFDLLAAFERGEDPDVIDALAADDAGAGETLITATPEAVRERRPGEAPAMPPGLAELLRSMATDAQARRGTTDPDEEDQ